MSSCTAHLARNSSFLEFPKFCSGLPAPPSSSFPESNSSLGIAAEPRHGPVYSSMHRATFSSRPGMRQRFRWILRPSPRERPRPFRCLADACTPRSQVRVLWEIRESGRDLIFFWWWIMRLKKRWQKKWKLYTVI